MNWKRSFLILIELGFLVFPANIIGCTEPPDPFDEYITFLRSDVAPVKGYAPFYYVEDAPLYNPMAPALDSGDHITAMWVHYCKGNIKLRDAEKLVDKSSSDDLVSLYAHVRDASTPVALAIRDNPMTAWLIRQHDTAAAKYLWLAKQAEEDIIAGGNVENSDTGWAIERRDSIGMAKLIDAALEGRLRSKNVFLRARYAFQAERLAFYDHHYADCIRFFDDIVKDDPASGYLDRAGLGYKAGALWHNGRRLMAAYIYSRLFTANPNTSDYMSFSWCVHRFEDSDRRSCLALCRDNREKAEMLGLFVLGSDAPENVALERIYRLSPGTPVQEVLAVREVNKIERNYLTPRLINEKGGRAINDLFWYTGDDWGNKWLTEAKTLAPFYDAVSRNGAVAHRGLFATVAAQLCYMTRQYPYGDSLLDHAGELPAGEKLRDQQRMTRLLLTINERSVVDKDFEQAMLPTLKWLGQKAFRDSVLVAPSELGDNHPGLWRQIYRNLLAEVLAKRYEGQKDRPLEALCIGAAEQMGGPSAWSTEDYVRNQLTTTELMGLLRLQQGGAKSDWDRYLVDRFPVSPDEVREVIAVATVREHRFHEALVWMKKIKDKSLMELGRNPFADLLFDNQDSTFAFDKGNFNKLNFVAEMEALSYKDSRHTATAKDLYRLATGYYNMTWYGRAWNMVRYDRSGNELIEMPKDLTDFQKDYYGCYTAEEYFKKAMAATEDRELKARCLFMMARCSQKQVVFVTPWDDGPGEFVQQMKRNKYFPELIGEYGKTELYREAFNTCSYLRDFVKGR